MTIYGKTLEIKNVAEGYTKEQIEQNIEQFTEQRNEALYDLYEMKRETLAFNEGVPDQGFGEKATANEELDAQWFANEVASQIPKAINKNFRFSERPYSVNDVMVGKIERG
jgi:hypothetical protein